MTTSKQSGKDQKTVQTKKAGKKIPGTKTPGKKVVKNMKAPKTSDKKVVAKKPVVDAEGNKKPKRYFKFISIKTGKSHGRYTGETPKQAASKGYTKMLKKLKNNGKKVPGSSKIYIRESTRGSARKYYGYEASRQKFDTPQERVIVDKNTGEEKTIVYNYRNKIKKIPVPEEIAGNSTVKVTKKSVKNSNRSARKANTEKSTKTTKSTKSTRSNKEMKKQSPNKNSGSKKSQTKPKAKRVQKKSNNAKAVNA